MSSSIPVVLAAGEGKTMVVLGSPYTMRVTAEDTGGAFSMVEVITEPGAGVPPHIHHRELEIFYILEGALEVTCGGKAFTANKGATAILPKGMAHTYHNPGKTPCRSLVLIQPAGFEKFFEEIAAIPGPPDMAKIAAVGVKYGLELLPPG